MHSFSANNLQSTFPTNPRALNSHLNPDVTKIMLKHHHPHSECFASSLKG